MFTRKEIIAWILITFVGITLAWACRLEAGEWNEKPVMCAFEKETNEVLEQKGEKLFWYDEIDDPCKHLDVVLKLHMKKTIVGIKINEKSLTEMKIDEIKNIVKSIFKGSNNGNKKN